MSSRSKREYLEAIHSRYKAGTRKQKKLILDEFCAACGYHRKHAIRLLKKFRRFSKPKHKKKGRSPVYQLTDLFETLNPFLLRKAMEKRLKEIFQLYCKNLR